MWLKRHRNKVPMPMHACVLRLKTNTKKKGLTMKTLLTLLGLTVMLSAAEGSALYQKCAACHGLKAEKPALGKSAVIAGWKADQTLDALKGYKAGSRNTKGMGAIMKGQTAALSDADMKALADYIATLK